MLRKVFLTLLLVLFLSSCSNNDYKDNLEINHNTDKRTAILTFNIIEKPIKKLALINFENDKDEYYYALEILYIDSNDSGAGYRIMAYRNDGYVDIYDDKNLKPDISKDESIAGKGRKNYTQTDLIDPSIEKDELGNIAISFEFTDIYERNIEVSIRERTNKNTKYFNILAPVGASSQEPDQFPLYLLYDFDFVKEESDVTILIDTKNHNPDPFPVNFPIKGYKRNFIRYSLNTNMIELFKTSAKAQEVKLDDNLSYTDKDGRFTYHYSYDENEDEVKLKYIEYNNENSFIIEFKPAISFNKASNGEILLRDEDNKIGKISGTYSIDDNKLLEINFDKGWQAPKTTIIEKIMFSDKSVFSTWPKNYYYRLEVDEELNKKEAWINEKAD